MPGLFYACRSDYAFNRLSERPLMKTGSKLAILVFSLVSIAHLLRLVADIDVTVGTWNMPGWVSVLGVIVPGLIAGMLWKESR